MLINEPTIRENWRADDSAPSSCGETLADESQTHDLLIISPTIA